MLISPDNPNEITGMVSREGEEVNFEGTVDVAKDPAVQAWLSQVEYQMRFTMAMLLQEAVKADVSGAEDKKYFEWVNRFPAQVALLATQVRWSTKVEAALSKIAAGEASQMSGVLDDVLSTLNVLAERVLRPAPPDMRKKYEQLITEIVHQRVEFFFLNFPLLPPAIPIM